MSDQWYYAKGNEKHGPVPQSALRELAEAGKLLPTDKVWQKGMTEWKDASTITALFPEDGPPPLPTDDSNTTVGLKQVAWNCIRTPWLVLWRFFRWVKSDIRMELLCGRKNITNTANKLWIPVNIEAPSLLLFRDGGLLRDDGFGAKWTYDYERDALIVLTPDDANVVLPIISVAKEELVLSIDGRGIHYRLGHSITAQRLAEMRAKQAEFAKSAARVAVSAVAVVGIATVGVLAAAGAAGAAAGGAGSGSGPVRGGGGPVTGATSAPSKPSPMPGSTPVKCPSCSGKGWYNPGERNERRCPNCGGQGIRYI